MMSSAIEALYIFDQNNESILDHVYRSRPTSSRSLLSLYLAHPKPRPSVLYFPNITPPTTLFSLVHANLLFFAPSSTEIDPLFVLEYLHRLCDVLEEFLGAPLLASKIENSYDVVAQLLGEMCDAGSVCNTEPNALRDVVNMPGWVDKLLEDIGLPGSSPALMSSGVLRQQLVRKPLNNEPAIPWRRANVKHTSNELYVDVIETLSVTLAPSGRPLAAFANGSILFTSKISGVPDLVLNLSVPSGKHTIGKVLELPTFHPCVRLARWKEKPGELSFIPPDGKFLLAGYEVNLLPGTEKVLSRTTKSLNLPITIEVLTSLGPSGLEFEVRLIISNTMASDGGGQSRPAFRPRGSGRSTPSFFGGASSSAPSLRDVVVTVPVHDAVRNITDLRTSRGEASFTPMEHFVEWRISTKDVATAGTATLRCTVVGPLENTKEEIGSAGFGFDSENGEYNEAEDAYQSTSATPSKPMGGKDKDKDDDRDMQKVEQNAILMPRSAAISFSVKGWLASGIRVDSLNVDVRKSRGLGEGIKPVKGAKYLTVSKKGVETRC